MFYFQGWKGKILTIFTLVLLSYFFFVTLVYSRTYLYDTEGHTIKLKDLKNKWIIINYWADWCDSCLEEIPELNKFFRNNRNSNIVIFGVNFDHLSPPFLNQVIRKTGIIFPVLLDDPNEVWNLGEVSVLPTTFIINPQGDVVRKVIGPNTEQSLLKIVHNRLFTKRTIIKQVKYIG